ncbi:unnamed protein product [Rotaria magnacalcarata]|uniref:Cytochrome P450 n=1 Tax=Rotaria magnacalcarata TaxID=392030 RepID=A0A816H787_9BILA|nr:unnamed protein product [Rotaria magnacalcarata]CAF1682220.1 unnamed protein product [Rotaria magnacalcarata]CAF3837580.1 unnamed protein product [Rotaria magnacalcarata]CAF3840429.1 unnamed protein product [Rotaria magnacalcarata]
MDDKLFELFDRNLYKISKIIHVDTTKTSAEILLDINKHVFISVKLLLEHKRTSTIHTEDTNDCFGIIVDKSSPLLDGDDVAVCILNLIMYGIEHPEEVEACCRETRDHSYATSNLSSAKSLVHIRAFVKEVLRLSLVLPVIILSTVQDFKWRGFRIQKQSTKFDVTRWLGENASVIPPHTYSPFGIGPRACIAEKYLFNLLSGILAVLLYHNNFEKVDSISEPQEGTFGLANLPPNFSLTATPLSARS